MQTTRRHVVVLVTAPDLKVARKLARRALAARLAACVQLVRGLESHYWWQGKLEASAEVLLVFKTAKARLAALDKLLLATHPYDTPEIVALALNAGTRRYLAWLDANVAEPARRKVRH